MQGKVGTSTKKEAEAAGIDGIGSFW